jgi:CheY-like chemotaxis protein
MADLRRILLVEDNQYDAELIVAALAKSGIANEVEIVRDGAEALEYLLLPGRSELAAEGNPAVVLLDLHLPKMDGLEVLERIKKDPALKSIPVVMLTSSCEEQDLVRSYDLGVNSYVVKPVDFQEFVKAVKQVGLFWGLINEPPPRSTI